jgi:hypothetical protein
VPPDARTGPLHCVPVVVLYADVTPCGGICPFAGLAFLAWVLGFSFLLEFHRAYHTDSDSVFFPLRSSPGPAEDFEYYLAVFSSSSSSPFFHDDQRRAFHLRWPSPHSPCRYYATVASSAESSELLVVTDSNGDLTIFRFMFQDSIPLLLPSVAPYRTISYRTIPYHTMI